MGDPIFSLSPWQQFGLIGTVLGVIIAILIFVLRWVLDTAKEVIAQTAEERKTFTETIAHFVEVLHEKAEQSKEFYTMVTEAHKYQRDEHKKMIENLEEQGRTLARMNGYKA